MDEKDARIAELERELISVGNRLHSADIERGNLAVMLRLLAHRIQRATPDDRQADAAMKLLAKYGLQGSVTRDNETVVENQQHAGDPVTVPEEIRAAAQSTSLVEKGRNRNETESRTGEGPAIYP